MSSEWPEPITHRAKIFGTRTHPEFATRPGGPQYQEVDGVLEITISFTSIINQLTAAAVEGRIPAHGGVSVVIDAKVIRVDPVEE